MQLIGILEAVQRQSTRVLLGWHQRDHCAVVRVSGRYCDLRYAEGVRVSSREERNCLSLGEAGLVVDQLELDVSRVTQRGRHGSTLNLTFAPELYNG